MTFLNMRYKEKVPSQPFISPQKNSTVFKKNKKQTDIDTMKRANIN